MIEWSRDFIFPKTNQGNNEQRRSSLVVKKKTGLVRQFRIIRFQKRKYKNKRSIGR